MSEQKNHFCIKLIFLSVSKSNSKRNKIVEERRDNKVPSKMDNPLFGGATMLTANRLGANDIPSLYTATVKSMRQF